MKYADRKIVPWKWFRITCQYSGWNQRIDRRECQIKSLPWIVRCDVRSCPLWAEMEAVE